MVVSIAVWIHHINDNVLHGGKHDGNSTLTLVLLSTNPGSNTPQNSYSKAAYIPSHKSSKKRDLDIRETAGKAGANSSATFSFGLLDLDAPVFTDQLRLTYFSFVLAFVVVWRTCQERRKRDKFSESQRTLPCQWDLIMMISVPIMR